MKRIMFLCTGNSCRSQMAEGFAREFGKGIVTAFSAGLMPCFVHPNAIKVMKEVGIDISTHTSKAMDEELLKKMDLIVTLCGHAERQCPSTPSQIKKLHVPIDDPVGVSGSEQEVMDAFRRARDEIGKKVKELLEVI